MIHGSFGRKLRTASENRLCGTSCSKSNTSFSVSLSPILPSARTKWPNGYLDFRGHESNATIILCLLSISACLVSILIFGIFLSAGTNRCLTFYSHQ